MRYKVTALSPMLAGDGRQLAPIDYMVWKDQVNILDQNRIFKLLARGPRLDGYLAQLKKAGKLDFASWGGFAQNFSARRIPFEHSSGAAIWDKTPAEFLFIPSFAANHHGQFLPGSVIKGALRTGLIFSRWNSGTIDKVAAALEGERAPRRPAEAPEMSAGGSQMRIVAAFDSTPVATSTFKIYLTRVANMDTRDAGHPQLAWKQAGRGNVPSQRMGESTPTFAEMAVPGTVFEGDWRERAFLENSEFLRAMGWRSTPNLKVIVDAANDYATAQLDLHAQYAASAGLAALVSEVKSLQEQLAAARSEPHSCLLCLGWGAGFLSKTGFLDTNQESYRRILRAVPAYGRAIRNNVPFPKSRRLIFSENQPKWLPGWVRLQLTH